MMEQTETKRCQSCGRKMRREEDRGTNADGTRNKDYCYMCFMNGKFTHPDIKIEELIKQGAGDWSKTDPTISYEQAKEELNKIIPKLKRWKKRSTKLKVIVSGLVVGIVSFLINIALSINPLFLGIYSEYANLYVLKPIENFDNWLFTLVGSLFTTLFLAVLYSYTEKGFGTKSSWKKGLFFGFLVWLVFRIPVSYYLWLTFDYPYIPNIIGTFNVFINNIFTGILLAILYKKV
jgi:hypothetical protein